MKREDMRAFATGSVSKALDALTVALYTIAKESSAESVHRLRVSIRRFTQASRVFRQYLPHSELKKISARLRPVMKAGGEVRDRDILIAMLKKSGMDAARFQVDRTQAAAHLTTLARSLQVSGLPRRWRERLLGRNNDAMA